MVAEFLTPLDLSDEALGFDAIQSVGPGGHFFGTQHTQDRYKTAFYSPQMKEFILMYDDVRSSPSPRGALLEFLQTTYDAGADLGKWDRKDLERAAA